MVSYDNIGRSKHLSSIQYMQSFMQKDTDMLSNFHMIVQVMREKMNTDNTCNFYWKWEGYQVKDEREGRLEIQNKQNKT